MTRLFEKMNKKKYKYMAASQLKNILPSSIKIRYIAALDDCFKLQYRHFKA